MRNKSLLLLAALLALGQSVQAQYVFSAVAPSGQTLYYQPSSDGTRARVVPQNFSSPYYDTCPTGNLIIPDSVTYSGNTYVVTDIYNHAFSGCTGLTSVTIPNLVTGIGESAFYGCTGLASVVFNADSCVSMGNYYAPVFSGCTNLATLTIGNNVRIIPNYAFVDCTGLTSVTIGNSVTSIGQNAFTGCTGLTSVTIPNSVTSIGDGTFTGCTGLTSVTIPNSVTSIDMFTFFGCTGLTSVMIPNSVTSIGQSAFNDCTGLTSVTIGNSVTSIGGSAFYNCTGLTSIYSTATVAPQLGSNVFYGVTSTIDVHIPCGSQMSYYSRWSYFSNFLEASGFSFSAMSADDAMGQVNVITEPTCQTPTAAIYAAAANGFRFDHWSDGNTDNPRTLTLTSDTALIGYFSSNSGDTVYIHDTVIVHDTIYIHDTVYVGVDDVEVNSVKLYQRDGRIVVEGAEGQRVTVFDAVGKVVAESHPALSGHPSLRGDGWRGSTTVADGSAVCFDVPATGVYLVKVGDAPARRIVVVR